MMEKQQDSEMWKYALLSLGVFLAIIILSSIFVPADTFIRGVSTEEEPLYKTKTLALVSGEKYAYEYYDKTQQTNITLTYAVSGGTPCTLVEIKEALNRTAACLDEKGNDASGSNISLEKPYFYIFAPYMLALRENWSWGTSIYTNIAGQKVKQGGIKFDVAGIEKISGRNSYKVKISSVETDGSIRVIAYKYVDSEKAVLLKETGNNYEIRLISSPFPLQQQAE